jgi:Carboxypeptidase regulatory-like domain/TonB dependent receptor-like, beta-barrel/TonB-dependent Receptor Plug Domain
MTNSKALLHSIEGRLGLRPFILSPLATTALLLFLLLSIAPMALAQGTGNISGYVRDVTGAAVQGANVTAVMSEQSTTRTGETDAQGFYIFPALPPGHYQITVEAQGFKKGVRPNVELTVSQNVRADVQLTVGEVHSEVYVTTTVPLVDTTSDAISGLVDDRRVVDLPLNGRNIISLAGILPGVTNVSAPQTLSNARAGAEINVNGSLPNATVYTFDGAYFNNPSRNTGLNFPPPDAIAQFRITTSNFPAEYGHNSGAQVEVVSKAGTQSFHGAAWEFVRNDALNAKNYFASSVPAEKQNQFGAALGGPIIKNKVFFFASYQGLTDHGQAVSVQALLPNSAERSGDFTGLTTTLKDPTNPITGLPLKDANGNLCVAGNRIAPGCISPVAVTILGKYVPQTPSGTLVSLSASPISDNTGNIRLDWNQSPKNLVYGHYYQDKTNFTAPFGNTPSGGTNIPNYGAQSTEVSTQNGVINDTYTLSPNLINQAIFSVLGTNSLQSENAISNSSLGINMPQYIPPGVGINVASNFSLGSSGPVEFSGINYQIDDDLSWTKGRHTMKFGFEMLKLHFNQAFIAPPSFIFSGARSNDPVADFMLGAYNTGVIPFGTRIDDDRTAYNSFYAQDQFRLNPRLTLTLGLRYEPFLQWKAKDNKLDTFVPGTQSKIDPTAPPGILFPGDPGISKGIAPADLNNFAPRLGFALDIFGDGRTSLRGGYGIFYNSVNANEVAEQNPPYSGTLNVFSGDISNPVVSTGKTNPPTTLTGTFNCTATSTYPFLTCPLFPLPFGGMESIDANLRLPMYQQYNLSIQRQITPTTMIEISYVGNTGSNIYGRNPNNPAQFITDPITGKPPIEGNVNDRVLHEPGIIGSTNYTMKNYAHSSYNSLQIHGEKRFGHGSTILANYTRAKSLDMVSDNSSNAAPPDPFDLTKGYGRDPSDRLNSFVVSWLLNVPIHFSNSVANSLFSGWTLSAVQSIQSGSPITFLMGTDVAVDGTGGRQYAQLQPGATASSIRISHPSRTAEVAQFFNTQAFVKPSAVPLGTYGNSGSGMISGPANVNTDAALLKTFTLPESLRMEFRLETFNTFNQVNFANPNSTATSAQFGKLTSAHAGREPQLALKLLW